MSYISYTDRYVKVEADKKRVNLGKIELLAGAKTLEDLTITGVQSMFKSEIDKRTYDVQNSIVAEGGSAAELLATLPSIQVDEEGGISMRGSGNILIYINGRPTNMSSEETESVLAQFPANSIKSIELITNPSSRYDAAGVGGIINIILKKEERIGLNGQANVSVGTRDKYQAGVNLNYGTEKVNFYTSYNYQYRNIFELSQSLRSTADPNVSPFLDQDFDTDNVRQFHMLRAGMDYNLNPKMTLGVYGQVNRSSRDRIRIYNQRNQNINRDLDSLLVRTLTEDQFSWNVESGVNYSYDIDSVGQRFYTSISYSRNDQTRVEFFDQLFFDATESEVPGKRADQIYARPQQSDLIIG